MDKIITTALLIVISIVMTLALFNIAYPAIIKGGDAITSMANRADERMKTQIAIIHAAGELNGDGIWQDTNNDGDFEVFMWVKNVGTSRIIGLDNIDVFFGTEGNFVRIPRQAAAGGGYPYWTAQLEDATDWSPTVTMEIAIHYHTPLTPGRYFGKVAVPAGVSSEYIWGM